MSLFVGEKDFIWWRDGCDENWWSQLCRKRSRFCILRKLGWHRVVGLSSYSWYWFLQASHHRKRSLVWDWYWANERECEYWQVCRCRLYIDARRISSHLLDQEQNYNCQIKDWEEHFEKGSWWKWPIWECIWTDYQIWLNRVWSSFSSSSIRTKLDSSIWILSKYDMKREMMVLDCLDLLSWILERELSEVYEYWSNTWGKQSMLFILIVISIENLYESKQVPSDSYRFRSSVCFACMRELLLLIVVSLFSQIQQFKQRLWIRRTLKKYLRRLFVLIVA